MGFADRGMRAQMPETAPYPFAQVSAMFCAENHAGHHKFLAERRPASFRIVTPLSCQWCAFQPRPTPQQTHSGFSTGQAQDKPALPERLSPD